MTLVLWATQVLSAPTYFTGRVVDVLDGDTFKIREGNQIYNIRLYGIDAPEKEQDYGSIATRELENRLLNKEVMLIVYEQDNYGRYVAEVFYRGESINRNLVADGHAWWYKQYSRDDSDTDTDTKCQG